MIELPELGLGGAPLGNLYSGITDEQAGETVDAAWDVGVRLFDTAPHYGLGLSEWRLGQALAHRSGFVLCTKVGRLLVPNDSGLRADDDDQGFDVAARHRRVWDFSRDGVVRSLDESLDRLGLDRVDIALIHDPDDHADQALTEAYPALEALRSQGVVKAIGVGMNQWQLPARFVRETDIDLVMLAGRYTLLDRSGASLMDLCAERGVQVLAAGVFNSGLLATHEPSGTFNYRAAPPEILKRARTLAEICERHGVLLPHAALKFPLRHPATCSVVVGARSATEIRTNAALLAQPIPDELWHDL